MPNKIKTHGKSHTRLYGLWSNMKYRCSKKSPRSKDYFLKGIRVCEQWSIFSPFEAWAKESGYKQGLFIDRIDGNTGYKPENCRWITATASTHNRYGVDLSKTCKNGHLWLETPVYTDKRNGSKRCKLCQDKIRMALYYKKQTEKK